MAIVAYTSSLKEALCAYYLENSTPVCAAVILSAFCESLDRLSVVGVYHEMVLSPEENRRAHVLSHYLDVPAYELFRHHLKINSIGTVFVRNIILTNTYSVIICQEV